MFLPVHAINSSWSSGQWKGNGNYSLYPWAIHARYRQNFRFITYCCIEMNKGLRQRALWKASSRGCHPRWAGWDVALFKVKKNKLWIWKAYRRETGELIDWECGGRDRKTLRKLLDRLSKWNVELYCTDNWLPTLRKFQRVNYTKANPKHTILSKTMGVNVIGLRVSEGSQ